MMVAEKMALVLSLFHTTFAGLFLLLQFERRREMTEGWLYVTVFLAEALLHFITKAELLLGHKLHVTVRYILGVLGFMVPLTFWLLEADRGRWLVVFVIWKTIVSAGLAVLISHAVEAVVNMFWEYKHKIEQLELQVKADDQGK